MARYDDFAESPFGPLCDHMDKVKQCVSLVIPMFESMLAGNWVELEERAQAIFRFEHEADQIKNRIREQMPRAFALPIFRGDLLAYLKLQDAMADTAEDIGVVLTLKNVTAPDAFVSDLRQYVAKVIEVCQILFRCSDQLADLRESDLTGTLSKEIMDLVAKADVVDFVSRAMKSDATKQLLYIIFSDIYKHEADDWTPPEIDEPEVLDIDADADGDEIYQDYGYGDDTPTQSFELPVEAPVDLGDGEAVVHKLIEAFGVSK